MMLRYHANRIGSATPWRYDDVVGAVTLSPMRCGGQAVRRAVVDRMESGEPCWVSDLMDLTGMGIQQAEDIPERHLLRSLRSLLQEVGTLTEQYAAWQNAIAVSASGGERDSTAPAYAHG